VALVICGSNDFLGSTSFDEIGRFKVATKPVNASVAIRYQVERNQRKKFTITYQN
jgi:hypothetical protein